jgi:hypothetical protein
VNQPALVEITDRQSAEGQLETAILLWFEEKDPSSIHTLAVAAQGLLSQMCKERRVEPSLVNARLDAKQGKLLRMSQNFFKHGTDRKFKHRKGIIGYVPMFTELVLVDCLSMYQRLFDTLTSLMMLFALHFWLSNPRAYPIQITAEGIEIEDLRRFTRAEFLEKVLPNLHLKVGEISPP